VRLPIEIEAEIIRPLSTEDLEALAVERHTKAPPIKRLSERHHMLAKYLSNGMAPGAASILCNYSLSRISILKADPTFVNLLEFYHDNVEQRFMDTIDAVAGMTRDAIMEMWDRIETEPEKIRYDQLLATAHLGLDRIGHGPSATNVQVNMDMAARMNMARRISLERQRASSIEQQPASIEHRAALTAPSDSVAQPPLSERSED
jgi:hypothetical protein